MPNRKRKATPDTSNEENDDKDLVHSSQATSVAPEVPIRDTDHLFASPTTIACAHTCVPCAYKVGLFDVALDKDFCKQVPNQRPEQCPRNSATTSVVGTLGFQPSGMSALTVGDGDFSFSLALARILRPRHTKSVLVATSYEDEETLREVYPDFDKTLSELDSLGAKVCYKVDATRLKDTLPPSLVSKGVLYHRICWNFPCSAIAKGQDGRYKSRQLGVEVVH